DPSNRTGSGGFRRRFLEANLPLTGAAGILFVVLMAQAFGWGQAPAQSTPQAMPELPAQLGAITPYLGVPVVEIELPSVMPEDTAHLIAAMPLKIGETLTRQNLHDAIQALFATGRFADIQAEADRTSTGVRLRFLTMPNFFIGQVNVEGVTTSPTSTQLV